jgi:hypothetical protein
MPARHLALRSACAALLALLGAKAATGQDVASRSGDSLADSMTAAATAPPNLLANPGFDGNLAGWSLSSGTSAVWSPTDAQGRPGTGSAAITTTISSGSAQTVYQCVSGIVPGASYTVEAEGFLPAGAPPGGFIVFLYYQSGPSCGGASTGITPRLLTRDRWAHLSATSTAPANTQSLFVAAGGIKDTGSGSAPLTIYVDNLTLRKSKCGTGPSTLCLAGGRFVVDATFRTGASGPTTVAGAAPFTADSGSLWFFDPANLEVNVKILDGCAVNNRFWVFAAATTDLNVFLRVTDTVTGNVKTYVNAAGHPFTTITDVGTFNCS